MKKILLAALVFAYTAAFSQTSATTNDGKKVILNNDGTWMYADCAELLKTENIRGQNMTSAKEKVVVANGAGGLSIDLIKGSSAVMINFSPADREVICVGTKAPMNVEFTDGTKITVTHMGKLNCEGNFSLFLGESVGTDKELELFKTKTIKKISIEYSKSENGSLVNYSRDSDFTADKAEKMRNIIKCLSNI
ncbi:hypothetical protein [Flavobacterium rhizosphaerae]|uniref:Uncharacterized protein n=1 Tax=Flavobacterium rhizosphaerae TaxID=3163298 RepID=A0ABW8YSY2_9FLAO